MLSSLSRSVDGHVVLITGAGSGIGRATAHLFAEYGSYVAVTDIDPQRVESVVQEINASGGRSKGWELDVTNAEKVKEVVEEVSAWVSETDKVIDVLVNNAGVSLPVTIDDPSMEEQWQRGIDVLLSSHMRLIRESLTYLNLSLIHI